VFGADVVVVERAGFVDGELEHLLGARRERKLAHGHDVGRGLHELLDFEADLLQVHFEVLEHIGCDAGAFFDQAQQHVFGADVVVVEAFGFLAGEAHDFAGAVGEAIKHDSLILGDVDWLRRSGLSLQVCYPQFFPNIAQFSS
jgi:hypothetical protein